MDSIPGAIPPSKDVTNNTTPPDSITTPKGRAMRWLLGIVFSAKMMTAAVSIQARFIIPRATKPTISPAQQPRQSTPDRVFNSRPQVSNWHGLLGCQPVTHVPQQVVQGLRGQTLVQDVEHELE